LLSWVSLGVSLGIISGIKQNDISRLLILTRPAHLQKLEGERIDSRTRDINRVEVISKILKSSSNIQPTNNIIL